MADSSVALITGRILGQAEGTQTATSIYSPPGEAEPLFITVFVCNYTGSNRTYQIFLDDDGTTYNTDTAIYFDVTVSANTTDRLPIGVMANTAGNLAVEADTDKAVTFTVVGTNIIA